MTKPNCRRSVKIQKLRKILRKCQLVFSQENRGSGKKLVFSLKKICNFIEIKVEYWLKHIQNTVHFCVGTKWVSRGSDRIFSS